MNDHQLAIGESTCGGRLVSKPKSHGGRALFDVTILTRLAMQRAATAREAIRLMGTLAEEYGYYGAEFEGPDALGEAGEALTVTDVKEAWVFHIHPDDSGSSAVWVAQRVPDGHITVIANQFIIREVNLTDTENFMGSSNLYDVAHRQGFWIPGTPFDFTQTYALVREHGSHIYSTRRVWRVMTLANPNLDISPDTDPLATDYPFSVPVSRALTPSDIMSFQRDHYEGTAYDMTTGPAAGPYGNPDRYDVHAAGNMTSEKAHLGLFERAISIFRASYSFVSVISDKSMSTLWFGPYAPHGTIYVPIYVHASNVPLPYMTGSLFRYNPDSAYWSHSIIGNWVSRFYLPAIPYVQKVQAHWENSAMAAQEDIAHHVALCGGNVTAISAYLKKCSDDWSARVHLATHTLLTDIVTTFHDGYDVNGLHSSTVQPSSMFYPKWWLDDVGYFKRVKQPDDVLTEEVLTAMGK